MKFTIYWRDGKRDVLSGDNVADAMTNVGYGQGALAALDFWTPGGDNGYQWNPESREWEETKEIA